MISPMRRSKERGIEDARVEALKRRYPNMSATAERLIRKGLRGLARNRHKWERAAENYFQNENCEINFATRVAVKGVESF